MVTSFLLLDYSRSPALSGRHGFHYGNLWTMGKSWKTNDHRFTRNWAQLMKLEKMSPWQFVLRLHEGTATEMCRQIKSASSFFRCICRPANRWRSVGFRDFPIVHINISIMEAVSSIWLNNYRSRKFGQFSRSKIISNDASSAKEMPVGGWHHIKTYLWV